MSGRPVGFGPVIRQSGHNTPYCPMIWKTVAPFLPNPTLNPEMMYLLGRGWFINCEDARSSSGITRRNWDTGCPCPAVSRLFPDCFPAVSPAVFRPLFFLIYGILCHTRAFNSIATGFRNNRLTGIGMAPMPQLNCIQPGFKYSRRGTCRMPCKGIF